MKKMIALFAAITMALGMSVSVMAAEGIESVELTKTYEVLNAGTTAPEETFTFNVAAEAVTDAADGITKDNMPMLQYNGINASEVTIDFTGADTKFAELTFPEYKSVGVYTYKITEVKGTTAGIVYDDKAVLVEVTVLKDNNELYVAGVTYNNVGGTKMTDGEGFLNKYEAGSLKVSKAVSGNMADDSKLFKVEVTFTAPAEKDVTSAITYNDGTSEKNVVLGEEAEISLKSGATVTFKNIPYGVTYTVVEDDYTGDGYDPAKYTLNGTDKGTTAVSGEILDSAEETVEIVNNKDSNIATGVVLDNLPYVLLLAVVVGGAVIMFLRKRSYERD